MRRDYTTAKKTREWAKHLKPRGKRAVWKGVRRVVREFIRSGADV